MGKVTHIDDRRPAQAMEAPTCSWADLHGLQGELRVAEHGGLSVLIFTDRDTGCSYVIGEKTDG